jgi:hypothetical protein
MIIRGFLSILKLRLLLRPSLFFYQNNLERKHKGLHWQVLQSKYIPAIMMMGTAPIFYRIPVTTALLQALTTASYPEEETTVLKFIPPVSDQQRYRTDGMRPLDNRRIILQCLEAFKAVIVCPSKNISYVHAELNGVAQ